jgi:hypothetical protein
MSTLIPLFAALIAALHSIAGMEVGASLLEVLVTKLHEVGSLAVKLTPSAHLQVLMNNFFCRFCTKSRKIFLSTP